jgi:tetratricopeptide (TPR) repeat protein
MSGPQRPAPPKAPAGKNWGGVARRGAEVVTRPDDPDDPEAAQAFTPEEKAAYAQRQARRDVKAARHQQLQDEAAEAISRAGGQEKKKTKRKPRPKAAKARPPLPGRPHQRPEPRKAFIRLLGEKSGNRAARDLNTAAKAFDAERFNETLKLIKPLEKLAPDVADVRELFGLTLYRLERWGPAIRELEEFRVLSGSTDQHPVLADCYRAQGRWADVDALWIELREASPSGELVTEGRIVAAGALADQGDLSGGLRLLQKSWKRPKKAKEHHLRRAYALADMHERAGEMPAARDLFAWIDRQDPGYVDVRARLAALT